MIVCNFHLGIGFDGIKMILIFDADIWWCVHNNVVFEMTTFSYSYSMPGLA